jgi:aromatic ring hydroxylase
MPARTGAEFLAGLRDGRELWVGADRVTDPAEHPCWRRRRPSNSPIPICVR